MACCGRRCAKILLVMGNSFFLVAGIALAAFGGFIRYNSKDYDTILGSNGLQTPANFIIAAGAIVFLVAFLGFCGACTESKCLLLIYIVLVGLIILMEIGCVAFAFAFRAKVEGYVNDAVANAIQKSYGIKPDDPITTAIDDTQRLMKCCGAKGVDDYKRSDWVINHKNNQTLFPTSCIDESKKNHTAPGNAANSADEPFDKGCIQVLKEWALENLLISGGLAAGVLFVELIGILGGTTLLKRQKSVAEPI